MNRLRANIVPVFMLVWLFGSIGFLIFMWAEEPMHFKPVDRTTSDASTPVHKGERTARGVLGEEVLAPKAVPGRDEVRETIQVEEFGVVQKDAVVEESVPRETWVDPVNQQVLGKRAWMGAIDPEEEARIDDVLNAPMPATPLGLAARTDSIRLFQQHADRCLERFPSPGRIVVIWRLRSDGTEAILDNLHFGPIVDVYPETQNCLLQFNSGRIATSEVFERWVEYPLIF